MKRRTALCATFLIVLSSLSALAADVTGTWTAKTSDPNASLLTFVFKQEGAKLTGTVATPTETTNISNGKVNGDKISFAGTMSVATFTYEGTLAGDEIKVTVKSDNSGFPAGELTSSVQSNARRVQADWRRIRSQLFISPPA